MADDVTFRGFAAALMQGQIDNAVGMLETLLGITHDQALGATDFFANKLSDPAFMQKAMGLRAATESKDDAQIAAVVGDCFGLDGEARATAVATIRAKHG